MIRTRDFSLVFVFGSINKQYTNFNKGTTVITFKAFLEDHKKGGPYDKGYNLGYDSLSMKNAGKKIVCPYPENSKEAREFWGAVEDGKRDRKQELGE